MERLLLHDGMPVDIGSRAFDLLMVLVRSPGTIVGKCEILDSVWPSLTVEESNLRFQMASLRKALGPGRDLIKTVQGRGYLFTGEVASRPVSSQLAEVRLADAARPRCAASRPAESGLDRVAVIDDDDDVREALEGLLRSSGFEACCYASVEAFIEEAAQLDPRCLVLDICMPGRNGLELQAELAEAGIGLPIIFISGHADVHMSVRAMKAGAIEFLTKPVRHEELLQAVHTAVRRH